MDKSREGTVIGPEIDRLQASSCFRPANPDALLIAQQELGAAFDRETMTYEGRVIRLHDLMRAVNRRRVRLGRPQILYNEEWRVPVPAKVFHIPARKGGL